tara:strand:- start:296 stop:544 length:249 start_codon:yes stop_codon:yes gene_type:complete
MEIVIFTLALCGLVIASLQFSYKNSQRINELEDKQEKSRKDINALYMKSLSKPKRKPTTKKPTTKKSSHQRKSSTKKQVLKG